MNWNLSNAEVSFKDGSTKPEKVCQELGFNLSFKGFLSSESINPPISGL
jgi:hypothetical protein